MTRLWGRTIGGGRLRDAVPAGRWRTLTLLGAVSVSGWVATMSIEAPTDGDVFLAYLAQVLCPQLRPGHCVVMDNLAAHRVAGVRELIEATGARLLYLPPYSPDFNPIEMAFSKLKALLKKAAARTVTDLWDAIAAAIDAIKPDECANYFAAAGYEPE